MGGNESMVTDRSRSRYSVLGTTSPCGVYKNRTASLASERYKVRVPSFRVW